MGVGELDPPRLDEVEQLVAVDEADAVVGLLDGAGAEFLAVEHCLVQAAVGGADPQRDGVAEVLDAIERDGADEVPGDGDPSADQGPRAAASRVGEDIAK